MSVKIPTMSTAGWIETPYEKAAYIIGCFIAANYSQNSSLYGRYTTLQYLVRRYSNQYSELQRQLAIAFDEKIRTAFPTNDAVTDVSVERYDDTRPAVFTIRLWCELKEKGRVYTVGKLVDYENSVMTKIRDIANG